MAFKTDSSFLAKIPARVGSPGICQGENLFSVFVVGRVSAIRLSPREALPRKEALSVRGEMVGGGKAAGLRRGDRLRSDLRDSLSRFPLGPCGPAGRDVAALLYPGRPAETRRLPPPAGGPALRRRRSAGAALPV